MTDNAEEQPQQTDVPPQEVSQTEEPPSTPIEPVVVTATVPAPRLSWIQLLKAWTRFAGTSETVVGVVAILSFLTSIASLGVSGWLGWRQVELESEQVTLGNKQIDLGNKQVELANKQMELMLKQDEILDRRAVLSVQLGGPGLNTNEETLVVKNDGRRAARDFYFVVRADGSRLRGHGTYLGSTDCARVNGRGMVVTSGLYPSPLYPTRLSDSVGTFAFWNTQGKPAEIEWQIVSEDGVFPIAGRDTRTYPEGVFGVLKVEAGGDPRPKDLSRATYCGP